MILDTSALLAIVVGEPTREACLAALEDADRLSMSAATLSECLIVSISRVSSHRCALLWNCWISRSSR